MTQLWHDLADGARRTYSQNGEEGVLETIFANVGEINRYLVDVGAGDGTTLSNTRLFLERGWRGARFDVAAAADVVGERITAENVVAVLTQHGVPTALDLLSLDIDGVDWYVLRAILRGGYRPRVICCEFNPDLPAAPAVAIAYDPAHRFDNTQYFGASLDAYRLLGAAYGYRLVHVLANYNAFFVATALVPSDAVLDWSFTVTPCWPPDPHGRPWRQLGAEDFR